MATEQTVHQASQESQLFDPPADFAARAHIGSMEQYRELHRRSLDEPEAFWREMTDQFVWFKPWTQLREGDPPFVGWFVDGETNITVNCLDRHVAAGRGDKVAFYWEGEPGDERVLTYADLLRDVQQFANALKSLGLQSGDRVVLYMPMVPELPVAMLACARIGVVHSVVFGGFSSDAVRDRIIDAGASAVITADGGWRRGRVIPLKANVDAALADGACPSVKDVVVVKRCENEVAWHEGRDRWWHEVTAGQSEVCEPAHLSAEHPLYILYTSGTTGRPKGVVHATAGYMVYTALTSKWVFDLRDDDIYWCTADIGWVTGHSYIVYGILANGVTGVMYEGAPNAPKEDRFWQIVEKYKVSVLYTAPTAIRTFVRWGDQYPQAHDLTSPASARHGGRADQPGRLALVSQGDRRRALPHRRHLVADRNRRNPDNPAAGRDHAETGLGHAAFRGRGARGGQRGRDSRAGRSARPAGDQTPLAVDDSWNLQRGLGPAGPPRGARRPRAFHRAVLGKVSGLVPDRRRGGARRRRLLLDHRAGGRHAQRGRTSHRHGRGRERARQPCGGGGIGRGGRAG